MSLEFLRRFRHKEQQQPPEHEIILGVPFKPFAGAARFCLQKEGDKPFLVPESYDHDLLLRRSVSLYGMRGCIDIISEDPMASYEAILAPFQVGQPFGLAFFEIEYHGKEDQRIKEQPYLLRFTFNPRTQLAYTKLLNSYAEVKFGEKQYISPWNLNRNGVEWNMQRLEDGGDLLVVEKNLLDEAEMDASADDIKKGREENRDIGRIGYVWLPKDLEKFRTVEITFRNFNHGSDQDQPSDPSEPIRKPEHILV